jgi:hypothetical protein
MSMLKSLLTVIFTTGRKKTDIGISTKKNGCLWDTHSVSKRYCGMMSNVRSIPKES